MTVALVVDDNPEVADAICQLLSLMGVKAVPAYGGSKCLEVTRELVPDVIFMDINMPELNGFDVISQLRDEPRFANVPWVVVTADGSLDSVFRAHKLGAVDLIVKPPTYEALEASIKFAGIEI